MSSEGRADSTGGMRKSASGTEEQADDDDAGDGGKHDGAQNAGGPAADDLLNDEEDGGDGCVKGGGEAGSGAYGGNEAHAVAGKAQAAADDRGEAGADLQRGIFGAERLSRADGQGGGDEFADGGFEGNVAVVDVEGGLGLIHAAAARQGKEMDDEDGDQQAGERGREKKPEPGGLGARAQEIDAAPVDGEAKADHGKPGKDADKDGKDEEKAIFAEDRPQDCGGFEFDSRGDRDGMAFFQGGLRMEIRGLSSTLLVQVCDQKQRLIGIGWFSAGVLGLPFDLKNQVHGGIDEVGIAAQPAQVDMGIQAGP